MALARVDADVTAYTVRRYQVTEDKVFPVSGFRPLSLSLSLFRASPESAQRKTSVAPSARTFLHFLADFRALQILRLRAKENRRGRGVNHARASANPGRSRRSRRSGENGKSRRGRRIRGQRERKEKTANGKKEAAGSREKEKIRANVKKRKSKGASRRVGRTKRERKVYGKERERGTIISRRSRGVRARVED